MESCSHHRIRRRHPDSFQSYLGPCFVMRCAARWAPHHPEHTYSSTRESRLVTLTAHSIRLHRPRVCDTHPQSLRVSLVEERVEANGQGERESSITFVLETFHYGPPPPPPASRVQFRSFSCSFRQNILPNKNAFQ